MPAKGRTTARGYGYRYRQERAAILSTDPPCYRCGALATTIDHVPPIAEHTEPHVHGAGCCSLWPCCARCNMSQGAHIANARRRVPRWVTSTSVR